jgi:hypothetical protein
MTLTDFIPGLKGTGNRRAVDKIAELRYENRKLLTRQMAADDYFAILMQDRNEVYAAWEFAEQARQEAEMVAACMQSERDEWRDETLALRARFGPQIAAEANAQRVDVPPMVRDTAAMEDQATGPIYVKPLWEALDVHYAGPGAAGPTHVPAWAVADESQGVA